MGLENSYLSAYLEKQLELLFGTASCFRFSGKLKLNPNLKVLKGNVGIIKVLLKIEEFLHR